ncbi:MAG TPA: thioredoxin family protein [Candidatus Krumholzibacteria bacterium]|nr:thioredoxin family protein [Candidatus Krumholzibacteria bacterium]
MVQTPSTMLPLGTPAPAFALLDPVTGDRRALADFKSPVLVVMFICNHCPFVIHVRDEFTRLERDYAQHGVDFVAINSNDIEKYPQDGPEKMAELVRTMGWKFPFLLDEDQQTGRDYHAACTPDFYVFDAGRRLRYRGQLDDSRPSNGRPVTGADLRAAIDAVLAGGEPAAEQRPSIGCNIKWKPGNEPEYFTSFLSARKQG